MLRKWLLGVAIMAGAAVIFAAGYQFGRYLKQSQAPTTATTGIDAPKPA